MTCPHCKQHHAHRSHRSGLADRIRRLFQMIPYRCRTCKRRFYAFRAGEQSPRMRTNEERKIMELRRRLKWKRTKRELIIYGFAALFVAIVIYLITRPSTAPLSGS